MEEIIGLKLSKVNFCRRWNFETKPTSRCTHIYTTLRIGTKFEGNNLSLL